jgi:hypothetical protein
MAEVFTAPDDQNYRWKYGDTIEHCESCSDMVAVGVQSAVYWRDQQAAGIYPQSPDLSCSGFHCDCELEPTDDPVES